MNALARAVYNLVTNKKKSYVAGTSDLSQLEREALIDLQALLHQHPRDLAALLAQGPSQKDWLSPLPSPRN